MSVGVRNQGVDLIRTAAILLVLLHHFNIAYDLPHSPLGQALSPWLVRAVCRNGNYGVTMFFAVSGFLITSNAVRRWGRLREVEAGTFYRLRIARIGPCLLLLLALVDALGLTGVPIFANQSEAGPPISFLQADLAALSFRMNVLMARAGWFNYCLCVLWSLSVEEVFYLAFPLLCRVLRRPALLVGFWLLVIAIGPTWRFMHHSDEAGFLYAYLACFDGIAIGCCTALLSLRLSSSRRRARWLLLAIPLMAALYLVRSIVDTGVWGVTAMAVGTAALLLASAAGPPSRPGRVAAGFGWLGRHSYELYLFHLPVLAAMRVVLPPAQIAGGIKPVWLLVFLLSSTVVAGVIARLVAEPANRALRRHLVRDRSYREATT